MQPNCMPLEGVTYRVLFPSPCNSVLVNDRGGREISVAAAAEFFPEKRKTERALFTDSYPSTYLSNYTTHSCSPTLLSVTISHTQECEAKINVIVVSHIPLKRFLFAGFTQPLVRTYE